MPPVAGAAEGAPNRDDVGAAPKSPPAAGAPYEGTGAAPNKLDDGAAGAPNPPVGAPVANKKHWKETNDIGEQDPK